MDGRFRGTNLDTRIRGIFAHPLILKEISCIPDDLELL